MCQNSMPTMNVNTLCYVDIADLMLVRRVTIIFILSTSFLQNRLSFNLNNIRNVLYIYFTFFYFNHKNTCYNTFPNLAQIFKSILNLKWNLYVIPVCPYVGTCESQFVRKISFSLLYCPYFTIGFFVCMSIRLFTILLADQQFSIQTHSVYQNHCWFSSNTSHQVGSLDDMIMTLGL